MIRKSHCPYCYTFLWDDNPPLQPVENNYAICIYCGEASMFDKNLHLKKPDKLPYDIKFKSDIAKQALKNGISLEEVLKNTLTKDGHIRSH